MKDIVYLNLQKEMFSLFPDLKIVFDEKGEDILNKFSNLLKDTRIVKTDRFTEIELTILRHRLGVINGKLMTDVEIAKIVHKRNRTVKEIKEGALKKLNKLIYSYIYVRGDLKEVGDPLSISLDSILLDFKPKILTSLRKSRINTLEDLINLSTKEVYEIYNIDKNRGKEIIDYIHFLGYNFRDELIKSDDNASGMTILSDLNISSHLASLLSEWHIYTVNDFMTKDINLLRLRKKVGVKTYRELKNLYIRCSFILRNEKYEGIKPIIRDDNTLLSKQYAIFMELKNRIKILGKRRSKLISENEQLDEEIEEAIKRLEATKIVNVRK